MGVKQVIKKLKPGQKWAYVAQVKDVEGDHPLHGSDWWVVKTRANPTGKYSTRKQAQNIVDAAKATYKEGKLIGYVKQVAVDAPVTLENIVIDHYITGNVVPISAVPAPYRDQYRDTLRRTALAAHRAGVKLRANSSFRTRQEQVALWEKYLAGGNLAARPGTSAHELGLALDIQNARNMPKFIKQARKLKIIDDVPSEDWHLTNHHRV